MTDGTVYSGSHWQRYATNDTDEAHAYIRRAFLDIKVRSSGVGRDGAGLRTVTTALADLGVTRLHYSARTQARTAPDGDLNITHLVGGRFTIARDKDEYRLRPGDVMLILPDQSADLAYDNVDTFVARLPASCSKRSPTRRPASAAPTCASTASGRSRRRSVGTGPRLSPT
ncbi:hypothetical protein [Micromonospora sp. NPDC048839]|uniref:AraC-like ligand-binding domain-containing protein n=1 Tax=Micromonospora sp. NPDC048839 TaxID=3155641 RepID=UPI00340B2E58